MVVSPQEAESSIPRPANDCGFGERFCNRFEKHTISCLVTPTTQTQKAPDIRSECPGLSLMGRPRLAYGVGAVTAVPHG